MCLAVGPAVSGYRDDVSTEIVYEALEHATDKDAEAIARLLSQLSTSNTVSTTLLGKVLAQDSTCFLVARADGEIVGMTTVVIYELVTGTRARMEDVVVDSNVRRRGIARALVLAAIEAALEREARTVDLTSRKSREAAIRLYESVGFRERGSSTFRMTL